MTHSIFRANDIWQLLSLEFVLAGSIGFFLLRPDSITITTLYSQIVLYIITLFFLVMVARILSDDLDETYSTTRKYVSLGVLNIVIGYSVIRFYGSPLVESTPITVILYLLPVIMAANIFLWRMMQVSTSERILGVVSVILKFGVIMFVASEVIIQLMLGYIRSNPAGVDLSPDMLGVLGVLLLLLGIADVMAVWTYRWWQMRNSQPRVV